MLLNQFLLGRSPLIMRRFVNSKVWRRTLTMSDVNVKDSNNEPPEVNLKTMKPPRSIQDPSRYLRRTFVPNFKRPRCSSRDDLEGILINCLKVKSCTTVTTGERYDLSECIKLLHSKGFHPLSLIPGEIVTFKYQSDGNKGDVMILNQNASIVCWGFDEAFVNENILHLVEDARINPLPNESFESEDMDYVELETEEQFQKIQLEASNSVNNATSFKKYGEASFLAGDLIVVNSIDSDSGLLDKAALSSGLARSTNLAVLENAMENHISKTRIITEKISRGVKLNLNESDALRSIGRLFLIRGKLNLYSELIETPDLYWSEPQLERIFKQTSKYLDIGPRINILNSKLDYSTDECRALMGVLNEKKSAFLEWIIIYLITLEICFEIYHFYERYWLGTTNVLEKKKSAC